MKKSIFQNTIITKKSILILTAIIGLTTMTTAKNNKTVTLRLIETSDVHGAFFPYDFTERKPMEGTLARVCTYVNKQRAIYGDNLILLENGDILQGQPTNYYTNFVATQEKNIAAEVVNYLKYDAQVFGNHDVETGHAVYDKWIKDLECPVLGANIIDMKSGKPYVEPYLMLERDGVRIAVLGMLTPAIPNWLHQQLWSGIRFEEMVTCARQWVKRLREKEEADVVVGLFHSGWEGGIVTDDYDEDASRKVAEQVEGLDVIFFGHDHTEHHSTSRLGTLCLDPSWTARKVAQATIKLKQSGGKWKVTSKQGELIDITTEEPDADYMKHFERQMTSVKNYVERKIGDVSTAMSSRDAFFGSSAFTDMIHRLQLELTHADISFNAPLVFDTQIEQGPIYMSDMFKLYRYENQVYTLRMTGREVKDYLEMSYDLWTNTMQSPDDHIMLLAPQQPGDNQRSGFKNYTFNFDSAAGIDYVVDVTRPKGQKVHIIQMSNGEPFLEDHWYRVAMNSYRGNGGGELLVRGAGIAHDSIPQRIEAMSERDQRYYLTQKIEREGTLKPQPLNNWRFVPDAWAKPALERDRKLIFKE